MRTLVRHIVILIVILSLALAAIIRVPQRDTNPAAYLFTNPDGSKCVTPCLLGANLDNIAFDEADATFRNHPFFISSNLRLTNEHADEYYVSREYENPIGMQAKITFNLKPSEFFDASDNEIVLRYIDNPPTFSEILMAIGKPTGLSIFSDLRGLRCNYVHFKRGAYIYHIYTDNQLDCTNPNNKVFVIYLRIYHAEYFEVPWIGFIPFERYLTKYIELS